MAPGTAQAVVVGLVAVSAVAALYRRPRGVADWQVVAVAALAALLTGVLSRGQLRETLGHGGNIVAFFLGLMLLNGAAEAAGLYTALARILDRIPLPGPLAVLGVGTPVTALLSNDATPLLLTPAVFRTAAPATETAYAVTFTADIASLLLPVSNPVALLLYDQLDFGPATYARIATVPALAAVTALAIVLLRRVPQWVTANPEPPIEPPAASPGFRRAFLIIAATMALAYLAASLTGIPLGLVCLGAGLAATVAALTTGIGARPVVRRVQPGVLIFVAGLLVLVEAAAAAGLLEWLSTAFNWLSDRPAPVTILGAIAVATALSNLVNNWPAALVLAGALGGLDGSDAPQLAAGVLIGCTIGANLTVLGSLSTIFWIALVRPEGMTVSPPEYARRALVPTLAALAAAGMAAVLATR